MRRTMSDPGPIPWRTLRHYWRPNLAVAAGAAVATAVLVGALVVGDSVRGSLRDLTLERLGDVDLAIAGQRFVRQEIATELAELEGFGEQFSNVAPAILLQGSTLHADSRRRASNVQISGVDGRFLRLFDAEALAAPLAEEGGLFPPAIANRSLAEALGAAPGDDLVIALKRWSEVPEGSLLGRKDTGSVVGRVRVRLAEIVEDEGVGRFGLATHQTSTFNLFVDLATLADELDQPGRANALLAQAVDEDPSTHDPEPLESLLRQVLTPDDLGLIVEPRGEVVSLESREFILDPSLSQMAIEVAHDLGARDQPILTYLVNALRRIEDGEPSEGSPDPEAPRTAVPYSTVTALGPTGDGLGQLVDADGLPIAPPSADGIVLNRWTADALAAEVGDTIELDYYEVGPREDLRDASTRLEVEAITEIVGLAADASLSQEYPGIADSDNMADWDPPFPIELSQITRADEDYWDAHRGTPKAFVAVDTGRELWRSRWGDLTALRFAPAEGGADSLATFESAFLQRLVERLPLATVGLEFQPVKRLGLSASGGATDFGQLFAAFSMFLIASAALLVALLFSLGVEQRTGEVGLLLALGHTGRSVRRRLLVEGLVVSAVGGLVGLLGAWLYAEAMMYGLRTWWLPAVGTSRLSLHLEPLTLGLGYLASVAIVLATLWGRIRRLRKVPTTQLLARRSEVPSTRPGRRAGQIAGLCLGLVALLLGVAAATGQLDSLPLVGTAGALLLVGLLALFARWLGAGAADQPSAVAGGRSRALLRMALANASRNRGRSLLSTTLVACASYMIVTVAGFQQDFTLAELGRDSGTGGFALTAESDVPLLRDPGTAEGRFELGIPETPELEAAEIFPLRLLPGDDTSCLNLYKPQEPRLLAIPEDLVARGGFRFQKTLPQKTLSAADLGAAPTDSPWQLLDLDLPPNPKGEAVVPVLGDANSTQWILRLGLGQTLTLENEAGEPLHLMLVGTLATSIFQSELLISERHFLEHFPGRSGWSVFLAESADGEGLLEQLEGGLEDYGFDAVPAAEKLESFHTVQNTYLSTFRSLGGLGLLLGTVGLAIVLLRGAIERRGELAALRAFGFRRATLTRLVVLENALLLAVGLGAGTLAALLTAAPNLVTYAAVVPWSAIATTLTAIFTFGLLACTLAAIGALRVPLLPALKAER